MHSLFLGSGDSDVPKGYRVLKMGIMMEGWEVNESGIL